MGMEVPVHAVRVSEAESPALPPSSPSSPTISAYLPANSLSGDNDQFVGIEGCSSNDSTTFNISSTSSIPGGVQVKRRLNAQSLSPVVEDAAKDVEQVLPCSPLRKRRNKKARRLEVLRGEVDDELEEGEEPAHIGYSSPPCPCSPAESSNCLFSTLPTLPTLEERQNKERGARRVPFDSVEVFLFEREEGVCSVPDHGDVSLGMSNKHHDKFLISLNPAEDCPRGESPLIPGEQSSLRRLTPLEVRRRRFLLRTNGVQIQKSKEMEEIRRSHVSCGCSCTSGECMAATCECSLSGIKCQFDEERASGGFPCSCSSKSCSNPEGRVEYDEGRVYFHRVMTQKRLKDMKGWEEQAECSSYPRLIRFDNPADSPHTSTSYLSTPPPLVYFLKQETAAMESSVSEETGSNSNANSPLPSPISVHPSVIKCMESECPRERELASPPCTPSPLPLPTPMPPTPFSLRVAASRVPPSLPEKESASSVPTPLDDSNSIINSPNMYPKFK